MLSDAYGREITDLRVSVTRRCNFSCVYCHDEGLGPVARPRAPHSEEISPQEVERIVGVAREFGVRSVKLTGGEPLVRSDLEEILARTVHLVADLSLTTNGSMLEGRAESLRDAGLKRVNVSIDTRDPQLFRSIRGGSLAPVLRGVQEALRVGLKPLKINMVLFRPTLAQVPEMVRFVSENEGLKLQLIQFMPELVAPRDGGVDIEEVRRWLGARAHQVLVREMHHRRIFLIDGAEVELVDPVANPEFCSNCHRLRVTHLGELKGCLNRNDDLVPTRGLDDAQLRSAFHRVITTRVPYYGVYVPRLAPAPRDGAPVPQREGPEPLPLGNKPSHPFGP